jgi:hypothetical protein
VHCGDEGGVDVPVTVKCRIGVDEQEPEQALARPARPGARRRRRRVWIHARKAWLKGLSPKENREIPPLDYDIVYRMKQARPDVFIGINGGIQTLDQAAEHLAHVDGVMLGRAAYQNAGVLADVDQALLRRRYTEADWDGLRDRMMAMPSATSPAAVGCSRWRGTWSGCSPACRGAALPADPVDRCGEGRGRAGGDCGGLRGGGFRRCDGGGGRGLRGVATAPSPTDPPNEKRRPLRSAVRHSCRSRN